MKTMKLYKRMMWLFTLATVIFAFLTAYKVLPEIFAAICAFCAMGCEVIQSQIRHDNETKASFGKSYMDSLAIVLVLISLLAANYGHAGIQLLYIIIAAGGGALAGYLLYKAKYAPHTHTPGNMAHVH